MYQETRTFGSHKSLAWLASLAVVWWAPLALTAELGKPGAVKEGDKIIRYLRANAVKYSIDANHIGVAGDSAGGHLVELLDTSGGVKDMEVKGGGHGFNPEQTQRLTPIVAAFLIDTSKPPLRPVRLRNLPPRA